MAAFAQRILLEAKRLKLDLVEDRHQDFAILEAFGIKFDNRVVCIQDTLADMLWLLLLKDVVVLELVDKVIAHSFQ